MCAATQGEIKFLREPANKKTPGMWVIISFLVLGEWSEKNFVYPRVAMSKLQIPETDNLRLYPKFPNN